MNKITWLHLSDLHLCPEKTGWDSGRILKTLKDDLKRLEKEEDLSPDLLFFTGDCAFGDVKESPIVEQFQEFSKFIDGVRLSFVSPIPKENVFIVPGNHDVNRKQATPEQCMWLDNEKNASSINTIINDCTKQWQRYMERLDEFKKFLIFCGYEHLTKDQARLVSAHERKINGVKIGIACFNSAWSCCREEEKGKLWVGGKWQFETLAKKIEESDIKLALMHHPTNWFVEVEDVSLARSIETEFNFCLHGHEHQGWVNASINNDHARISSAACYQRSDKENGYNFVKLDATTGTCEVFLRKYDPEGMGWVARPIAKKAENGKYVIENVPCLQKVKNKDNNMIKESNTYLDKPNDKKNRRFLPNLENDFPEFKGFKTVGEIGIGSFGNVYLVKKLNSNMHFAIKHFKPNRFSEKYRLEAYLRFTHGIKLIKDLPHPNIVSVIESVDDSMDKSYYVMDYYDSGNLQEFLFDRAKKKKPLSLDNKLDMFNSICDILIYAHANSVVHRDIKPTNILIDYRYNTDTFVPKLTDFDLAFRHGETGITFGNMGSIFFMPPEVRKDLSRIDENTMACIHPSLKKRSEKIDVFAMGGTLHFLITHKYPPLGGIDEFDEHYSQIINATKDNSEREVLLSLREVIKTILSEKIDERPASIIEMQKKVQQAYISPKKYMLQTSNENNNKNNKNKMKNTRKMDIDKSILLSFYNQPNRGVIIISGGKICEANEGAIQCLQVNKDEVIGKKMSSIILEIEDVPLSKDDSIPKIEFRNVEEVVNVSNVKIANSKNNIRYWNIMGMPIKYHECESMLYLIEDRTDEIFVQNERQRLEEQLRQAQKMEAIGRLAGGVAHDFNNILTAISGYSEMILDYEMEYDDMRENVVEIKKATDRASSLTQQLLAFSRKQIISPVKNNLNDMITSVIKMISRIIGEDISLKLDLAKDECVIEIDTGQLDQILVNLAVNARDAMKNGGEILIKTEIIKKKEVYKETEYVLLSFADNGCGMSLEVQENIFEPFFTTKPKGKGTGLGLSTVYGIVMQNEGLIELETEENKGTIFKIYFPRKIQKLKKKKNYEIKIKNRKDIKILVAEDEHMVRNLTCKILIHAGFKVLEARLGSQAIDIFKKEPEINMLLTDIVMPEMNGIELVDKIKEIKPEIKVCLMTGYSEDVIYKNMEKLEKDNITILQKPFTYNQLLTAIEGKLND